MSPEGDQRRNSGKSMLLLYRPCRKREETRSTYGSPEDQRITDSLLGVGNRERVTRSSLVSDGNTQVSSSPDVTWNRSRRRGVGFLANGKDVGAALIEDAFL